MGKIIGASTKVGVTIVPDEGAKSMLEVSFELPLISTIRLGDLVEVG